MVEEGSTEMSVKFEFDDNDSGMDIRVEQRWSSSSLAMEAIETTTAAVAKLRSPSAFAAFPSYDDLIRYVPIPVQ